MAKCPSLARRGTQALLEQMGRSSLKPATCLQNPVTNALFVWGTIPCLYLIKRFHLGIENYNIFIEKKEDAKLIFQILTDFSAERSCSTSWKHLPLMCIWKKLSMWLRDAHPRVFPKQPFQFPSYLNRNIFQAAVLKALFWGENMNLSPASGTATGLLGQGSFPLHGFPHL